MSDRDTIGEAPVGAPIKEPTEARQGVPVNRMRYVLGIGIACVVIGFALVALLA